MRLLLLALALTACTVESDRPRRTAQDRQQAADAAVSKTPLPRTYRYADGELRVMEVPVKDSGGFVDYQRCFVWRDDVYKAATMSCGQMPDLLIVSDR